jgi:hypothetical protein
VRRALLLVVLVSCAGEPEPEDKPSPEEPSDPQPTGTTPETTPAIDEDEDGFAVEDDCDDTDPAVYPGAPDLCGDGRLTDCDRTDEDGLVTLDGTQGFADLHEALLAASSGSELLLCPGQYVGPFETTVPVSLVSLEGAEVTALDGDGAGSALALPGGSTVTGLTLTGGSSAQGGGLRLTSEGTLLVQDCAITGNHADLGGGLALFPGSTVTLAGTTVANNSASEEGGGLFVGAGALLDLGDSVVTSNVTDGSGGGVALHDAALAGGTVSDNSSNPSAAVGFWTCGGPWGGGIYATGDSEISGTDVHGNTAIMGGGLGAVAGRVVLTDVLVHGHQGATMGGTGINACSVELELLGATEVYENSSSESGAGLYASASLVEGGVFRDNVADWAGGGVVLLRSELVGATIVGNQADRGAGVALWTGTLRECTVTANGAVTQGGGLDVVGEEGDEPSAIYDTIVADNTAPAGAALSVYGIGLLVELSSVWRNASVSGGAVVLQAQGTLQVLDSDFGTDADDNLPVDLQLESGAYSFGHGSFSCDETECE